MNKYKNVIETIRNLVGLTVATNIFVEMFKQTPVKIVLYKMGSYLIIDTLDIIFLRENFKNRNEIILHHINSFSICIYYNYCPNKEHGKIFLIQELTTVLIFLRNLAYYKEIKQMVTKVLKYTWIPARLMLPIIPIYYTFKNNQYNDEENNIYLKVLFLNVIICYIQNIKWTIDFL